MDGSTINNEISLYFLHRPKVQRDKPPLYKMEFSLIGKLDRSKDEIKKHIEKLGGKLVTSVHDKMAAVISNEDEVEKMNEKMQKAKSFGIQVVPLKFLDEVKTVNALKYIKSQSICDWGSDVSGRLVMKCSFLCTKRFFFWFHSRLLEFLKKRHESSRRACTRNRCRSRSLWNWKVIRHFCSSLSIKINQQKSFH